MVMGVVTAHAIAPHLLKLGYDNNKDLIPVAFVGSVPNVLVVGNSVAANSVAELVAMAKKHPHQINFASSGTGSTQHIAAEVFKDAAGVDITHVPYKGSAAALVDLVSGQVQMSFDTMPSVIGQIKAGKLRPLAVTSPQRNAQLSGVEISAWYGIYMPASTPKAVVQKVHDEVNKVIAMPETKTRLEAVGAELRPMAQADFASFHMAEYQRFGDIIRKNNIKLD
jgi:tripartite-type tricarboxylate transporter receptor subunit TctC